MHETIQIDLGGGTSLALPVSKALESLSPEQLTKALLTNLQATTRPAPTRYKLGEYVPGQGGIFVGDIRGDDGVVYGLIAATKDSGKIKWGPDGSISGLSSWDGLTNTNTLKGGRYLAAQLAADYEADGHVDFYLPAQRELVLAWANTPHLFTKEGWYWTSTPYGSGDAWVVVFELGGVDTYDRGYEWRVRPFRRFTY